jgi:hypothetical protein
MIQVVKTKSLTEPKKKTKERERKKKARAESKKERGERDVVKVLSKPH